MQPKANRLERIYWRMVQLNLALAAGAFFFVPNAAPAYLLGAVCFTVSLWSSQRSRKEDQDE